MMGAGRGSTSHDTQEMSGEDGETGGVETDQQVEIRLRNVSANSREMITIAWLRLLDTSLLNMTNL